MKNNQPKRNKPSTFTLKKSYYITIENAGKRTAGASGHFSEGIFSAKTHCPR